MREEGRHDKEDRPPDQRTRGARDRDRILYTSALRRLAEVTQVVSPFDGHVFHNRLTHTLEVAQIARRLGEQLAAQQREESEALGIDLDVLEAAALAHDIGHPPFGHLGEEVLLTQVEGAGDRDGFEGNAQSFRIVTKLAVRNESLGLNLCRATLNAILKYPHHRSSASELKQHWKFGAYLSEKTDLEFARKILAPGDSRKTAEAEIMDWADDVAYSVHDLDDFYRAGRIPLGRLGREEESRVAFAEKVISRHSEDARRRPYLGKPPYSKEEITETLAELLPKHFEDPYQGSRDQRVQLRIFTAHLIDRYIRGNPGGPAVQLVNPTDPASPHLKRTNEAAREVYVLQQLTSVFVFDNPGLATVQVGQRTVLKTLFQELMNAAKSDIRSHQAVLPDYFRDLLASFLKSAEPGHSTDAVRARVVADTIAAMTEKQAVSLFQRLSGQALGFSLDTIVC
ncbi:MAG TPA: dNTP triphosphohydrolase [Thermoanaerobaculaceae bacterium]|nr:dNTP triphosphohydrolase [Thermoanaerobaculaceae bacterium]HPS77195.1 dNTP triphosphohydrolase [Thermoanaerobaculaceae bacterium]